MAFNTQGDGDPLNVYVTDQWIIDQFVGSKLWAWGHNTYGTLGDSTAVNKSSPVQTVASGQNWKQLACGYGFIAAVKTDGSLWLWGYNSVGQLGDNSTVTKSSPVQTVAGGTNWASVAGNMYHTAAIKNDGSLWLWGQNSVGLLGDGTTVNKSSPVQTVASGQNWASVSCGGNNTAAIKTDGSLWIWGHNAYGTLGDNTVGHKSSPVQTVAGGNNWKTVACGYVHTAAIKNDGSLWLWGNNRFGQLGDGTISHKSSPVQTVCQGNNWKSVACGYAHTAAIKDDGSLWVCGYNKQGQLGDGTVVYKSSPVQTIAGGNNWKSVACGSLYTAAIKTDSSLWLWGRDTPYGMLGDNTSVNKSSPVQTICQGNNWKSVACGYFHTAALTF